MGAREEIVRYAQRQIGCEYSYVPSGGVEGASYNCSFLTTCAYRAAGLDIPHWQGHQNGDGSQSDWVYGAGNWVTDPARLKPGDLVFFGSSRLVTGHVGISLGGTRMIDSIPSGGVQERRLQSNFVGGGWPLAGEAPAPSLPEGVFPMDKIVTFDHEVNIRTKPTTRAGRVVGSYGAGQSCVLDGVALADGRCWGTYLGASTGARRYVCLGTANNLRGLS